MVVGHVNHVVLEFLEVGEALVGAVDLLTSVVILIGVSSNILGGLDDSLSDNF